jgi:hypothetical protein
MARTLIAVATHGVSSGAFSRRATHEAGQSGEAILLPPSIPISFVSPDRPNDVHGLVHAVTGSAAPSSFTITNHAHRWQKDDGTGQRARRVMMLVWQPVARRATSIFPRLLALALCLICYTSTRADRVAFFA